MIIQLNSIGDTHTVIMPFEEQASGIASVAATFGGLTLTRSVTVEYRHSTDNATWSAWLTFDTATLSALTFDPDNALYQQVRATRTGSDTTGIVSWEGFNILLSIDETAFFGRGSFTDTGLFGEVGDFLISLIRSEVVRAGGLDRFEVVKGMPAAGSRSQLAVISVSGISVGESNGLGVHGSRNVIQANIQIGATASTLIDEAEGVREFELMAGRISAMFSQRMADTYLHSFTWKGVDFVGAHLGDFGLSGFQVLRTENFFDKETRLPFVQISVRAFLGYSKFALQLLR